MHENFDFPGIALVRPCVGMLRMIAAVRSATRTKFCSCALPVLLLIMVFCSPGGRAQSVSAEDAKCQALATADFSTISDAPTRISKAILVKDVQGLTGKAQGNENLSKAIGQVQPTCRVSGYVAPNAGFVLLLPVSQLCCCRQSDLKSYQGPSGYQRMKALRRTPQLIKTETVTQNICQNCQN